MHEAVRDMLKRYSLKNRSHYVNALREILQSTALLGLWRSKFFEKAAFYGGTALRIVYGMERYSEDMDFSLLKPDPTFTLKAYGEALKREIQSFGFEIEFERKRKQKESPIESAFLKTNTKKHLFIIEASEELLKDLHPAKILKIKLEVDIDPPAGFKTETKYVLQPIPFNVRAYCLPDLFAGKLHAVMCRSWGKRVKGRDWHDLIWFIRKNSKVNLDHLEARMRQTGHYQEDEPFTVDSLRVKLKKAVNELDVESAKKDAAPFLREPRILDVWSRDFFLQLIERIEPA